MGRLRGRGRGGSRGRGGGANRGRGGGAGSGGRRAAGAGATSAKGGSGAETVEAAANRDNADLDVRTDVRGFFLGVASFDQHHAAQTDHFSRYAAALTVLMRDGVELPQNTRIRALAAALSFKKEFAQALLCNREKFGLNEVLKAVAMLDTARQVRVWEKKSARIQANAGAKVRKGTLSKLKYTVDNLNAMKPSRGSASGAICKHIRRWVRRFSAEELEFYALHFPKEPWKKLADIVHFHPANDFTALPWFLPYCYGQPAPDDSCVHRAKDITEENVNSILAEIAVPFTDVKHLKAHLTDRSKAAIARGEDKVDRAIWWYEDLKCPEVDAIILQRLSDGERVHFGYGKLMERLLTLKLMRSQCPPFFASLTPLADEKLKSFRLKLDSPIAVLGDASSSMNVAIRTSTIVASLLSAICNAKLVFFNSNSWSPDNNPHTIADILELACKTVANGCTSHASALYPFYERKEVIKTFIIVTDEEENTAFQGYKFLPLFKKYIEEVYSARLVFMSFLAGQHKDGQMVRELKKAEIDPLVFTFDGKRPDLGKLDNILGQLAMESTNFEEQIRDMEGRIDEDGLNPTFENLFGQNRMEEMNQ